MLVNWPGFALEMLLFGLLKCGWLKRFEISPVNVIFHRSVKGNVLATLRWWTLRPWPSRMFIPLSPNRPMFCLSLAEQTGLLSGQPGILNADGSNHCVLVRWSPDLLPSAIRSGSPPRELVFDGSMVEKDGEKYCPVPK